MAKSSRPDPFSQSQEQMQQSTSVEGSDSNESTAETPATPPDLTTATGIAAYLEKELEAANNMSKAEIMALLSGLIKTLKG